MNGDRRALVELSTGHAACDLCQAALPALVPFLVLDRDYSYAFVGVLLLSASLASSVVQPLFGIASDRWSTPWVAPAGILLAAASLGLLGVLEGQTAAVALAATLGLGVAAFHPEAARWAIVAASGRASGMSIFAAGSSIGFLLGPALVTPAVIAFGLSGTLVVATVPVIGAVTATAGLRRLRSATLSSHHDHVEGPARWGAFTRLTLMLALQVGVGLGVFAFGPLFLIQELGASRGEAGAAGTLLLACGAAGALAGGRLADTYGARPVMLVPLVLLMPVVLVLPHVGLAGAFAVLAVTGVLMDTNLSPSFVVGQRYLPGRSGLAAGLLLGATVAAGGLISAALGVVADRHGLEAVFGVSAGLLAVALALGWTLPREN